jgi:antitoxin HicB
MRGYPVNLRRDGKFFLVTFPDIPEAITQGRTHAEALTAAKEALEASIEFYFEDRRQVPPPSKPKRGQSVVELPASLAAKVLLLNEMLRQNVRPAELARRIGTTAQEVNRLTNIRHTSKIDGVDQALRALGKRLVLDAA